MQTKAKISTAIVGLAGPIPDQTKAATARDVLAWVLGYYGDVTLNSILFGTTTQPVASVAVVE